MMEVTYEMGTFFVPFGIYTDYGRLFHWTGKCVEIPLYHGEIWRSLFCPFVYSFSVHGDTKWCGAGYKNHDAAFVFAVDFLAVKAILLPNSKTGLAYDLIPDFKRIKEIGFFPCIFAAMGQLFFIKICLGRRLKCL